MFTQEEIQKVFDRFGWLANGGFMNRYNNDVWTFNLTNALVESIRSQPVGGEWGPINALEKQPNKYVYRCHQCGDTFEVPGRSSDPTGPMPKSVPCVTPSCNGRASYEGVKVSHTNQMERCQRDRCTIPELPNHHHHLNSRIACQCPVLLGREV